MLPTYGCGYHLAGNNLSSLAVDVTVELGKPGRCPGFGQRPSTTGSTTNAPDRVQVLVGWLGRRQDALAGRWYDLSFPEMSTSAVTLRFTKWNGHFADYLFLDEIEAYGPVTKADIASYQPSAGLDPAYLDAGSESTDGILARHYTDRLSYAWAVHVCSAATADRDGGPRSRCGPGRRLGLGPGVRRRCPQLQAGLGDGADECERGRLHGTSPDDGTHRALVRPDVRGDHGAVRPAAADQDLGSVAEYVFVDELTVRSPT